MSENNVFFCTNVWKQETKCKHGYNFVIKSETELRNKTGLKPAKFSYVQKIIMTCSM